MRSNPFGPNCEDLFLYFMMRFVKASIKAGGVGVDSREVWQKGAFVVGIYWLHFYAQRQRNRTPCKPKRSSNKRDI